MQVLVRISPNLLFSDRFRVKPYPLKQKIRGVEGLSLKDLYIVLKNTIHLYAEHTCNKYAAKRSKSNGSSGLLEFKTHLLQTCCVKAAPAHMPAPSAAPLSPQAPRLPFLFHLPPLLLNLSLCLHVCVCMCVCMCLRVCVYCSSASCILPPLPTVRPAPAFVCTIIQVRNHTHPIENYVTAGWGKMGWCAIIQVPDRKNHIDHRVTTRWGKMQRADLNKGRNLANSLKSICRQLNHTCKANPSHTWHPLPKECVQSTRYCVWPRSRHHTVGANPSHTWHTLPEECVQSTRCCVWPRSCHHTVGVNPSHTWHPLPEECVQSTRCCVWPRSCHHTVSGMGTRAEEAREEVVGRCTKVSVTISCNTGQPEHAAGLCVFVCLFVCVCVSVRACDALCHIIFAARCCAAVCAWGYVHRKRHPGTKLLPSKTTHY